MFIVWRSAWFILDSYSFGMYKELKYSLVESLYFTHEISEVLISKNYRQIYTKMSTKFGRASDQSIVLFFYLAKFSNQFYFFVHKQQCHYYIWISKMIIKNCNCEGLKNMGFLAVILLFIFFCLLFFSPHHFYVKSNLEEGRTHKDSLWERRFEGWGNYFLLLCQVVHMGKLYLETNHAFWKWFAGVFL